MIIQTWQKMTVSFQMTLSRMSKRKMQKVALAFMHILRSAGKIYELFASYPLRFKDRSMVS